MLNSSTTEAINDYATDKNVWKIIDVEIWHVSVWLSKDNQVSYGALRSDWSRVIPKWLIESILDGFELVKILEKNKKQVNIVLSLSDIHKVTPENREILKTLYPISNWLIDLFHEIWLDPEVIKQYSDYLKRWKLVVQSDWQKSIYNKLLNVKERYPRKSPEQNYNEKWYIVFSVEIWEYNWLILFSDWCLNDKYGILQYWIPLLIWEKERPQITQCWPIVAWIHRQISLDNNKEIITVDNKYDPTIQVKSLRWHELMKVFYSRQTAFLTPINTWDLSFLYNHWQTSEKQNFTDFKDKCTKKLIEWGFVSAKIHWENDYLFTDNNTNVISCDVSACNLNL